MEQRVQRRNERILVWLRAVLIGGLTYAGLAGMSFTPRALAPALGLAAGLFSLAATDLGILTTALAFSLPVTAADPVAGVAFLVLAILAIRYLGADGGKVFIVVGVTVAGGFGGPVWAAAAIAGYVLGVSEGALAAGLACAALEVVGLLTGRSAIGPIATGGSADSLLLAFGERLGATDAAWPDSLISGSWVGTAFSTVDAASVERFANAFAALRWPAALVAQPLLFALGAIVTGMLTRRGRETGSLPYALLGAAAGSLLPAAGSLALAASGAAPQPEGLALAAASSAALACIWVGAGERLFPYEIVTARSAPQLPTVADEDADVDELLRLIASAEEKLATEHTTHKVVMLTDMKSFSRMTEEDGSVLTAKAIQKHRDLLLPLIEQHGGHGKSTGGDGLIASFDSPAEALAAAVEMQRALDRYNAAHPDQRPMTVRIGVADGEVVLDKGGRPFIGAAINLAARVMNLADGGQILTTAEVAKKAARTDTVDHGEFQLKNIGHPVHVIEVLWAPGQQPKDPGSRGE